MTNEQAVTTGAEEIEWDLSDLYATTDENGLGGDLATIEAKSLAFNKTWSGKLSAIDAPSLVKMLEQYEELIEIYDRMASFTNLMWTTDSENVSYAKMMQTVQEQITRANSSIVFVVIQLLEIPDDHYKSLIDNPLLASRRHWLKQILEQKPYVLTEEVERALSAKSVTARASWVRLHDEISNSTTFLFKDREYTQSEIVKLSYSADRDVRKTSMESFSAGLRKHAHTHAYIFNTVVADCETNDRMRGYPSWISSRNLSNEVSDASVQALVDAVVGRYDLFQRYYRLKKRLLGVEVLCDYDRNAPISKDEKFWTWENARATVLDAYSSFHPQAGSIAQDFFDRSWIHAPVRKGKRSGAYSAGTIASVHPYVFMNYTGTSRDVQTLAHELGHGIHQYLSRQQGPLLMDTPLTVAETASVFGEMLTFKRIYAKAETPTERLGLLTGKIEGMLATVFRQVALNRFENAVHTTRRSSGEISLQEMNGIWLETQQSQFGDAIVLSPGYETWWSYISHFIHTPGYVYAYAFGELLVLSLYEKYQQDPDGFAPMYMDLLSSGGSKSPQDLLAPFGIDLDDPGFWNVGLASIEHFVAEAEQLASNLLS